MRSMRRSSPKVKDSEGAYYRDVRWMSREMRRLDRELEIAFITGSGTGPPMGMIDNPIGGDNDTTKRAAERGE